MKNITIYFIILLLFGFSSALAQATKVSGPDKAQATNLPEDPRLSPEEQALMLIAGENNPAKIDETSMTDPKLKPEDLPTEKDFGPSNARPAGEQEPDPKLVAEKAQIEQKDNPVLTSQPLSGGNQPAGEKAVTVTDYRAQTGGIDQPKGESPASITNYKEIQGPGQQPAGDTPGK